MLKSPTSRSCNITPVENRFREPDPISPTAPRIAREISHPELRWQVVLNSTPSPARVRDRCVGLHMGQVISYGLTQPDVEEVAAYCGVTQAEISALYKRFRSLDRGRRGFLTMEVLLNIPELSINPLAHRMVRMFEGVNFKDFCRLLAPFNRRASVEMKMMAIHSVFDVDGDGIVSRDDMDLMLRQLAGTTLTDEEIAQFIDMAFNEANGSLSTQAFREVLSNVDLSMDVDFPVHF